MVFINTVILGNFINKKPLIAVFLLIFIRFGSAGVFPGTSWEVATPASQGVDGAKLTAAMNYLQSKCKTGGALLNQAVLVRYGHIIWQGNDIDNKHHVYSCTKSFTGTVLGLLADEGKVSLATLAKDHNSKLAAKYPDLTLEHITTLTSGYNADGGTPFTPLDPNFTSGTNFFYSNVSMDMLGYILTRAAGKRMYQVFKERIADPISMKSTGWTWTNYGTVDGMIVDGGSGAGSKGITICARELARVGLLLLNRGNWNGTQLLSSAWVDAASQQQAAPTLKAWWFGTNNAPDWMKELVGRYGYNFWVNGTNASGVRLWPNAPPKTYTMQGLNDNYCWVIPEWDMVFVRLSASGKGINDVTNTYNTFFNKLADAIVSPVADGNGPAASSQPFGVTCSDLSSEEIHISFCLAAPEKLSLTLVDITGQAILPVADKVYDQGANTLRIQHDLGAGLYCLSIKGNHLQGLVKVLVQE